MKNRSFLHPATCFFLLTMLVIAVSWVGSIYAWSQVNNLLSAEGFRWLLRYSGQCFTDAQVVGAVLILFLGGGLFVHSGLWKACRQALLRTRKFSRKERRGLLIAWLAGGVYALLWVFLAVGPFSLVRSAIGTLSGSPLADGVCYVVSLGLGLMGTAYGFITDLYRTDSDVIRGMAFLFRRLAAYFVTLFFVTQFFAVLYHSGIYTFFPFSPMAWQIIYYICCLFPLASVRSRET